MFERKESKPTLLYNIFIMTHAEFELPYSANQADALPIELPSQLGRAQVQIHF
jgi:hypothetical protein